MDDNNAVTIVLKAVDRASRQIRQVSNELKAVGGVSGRVGSVLGNIPLLASGGWARLGVVLNGVTYLLGAVGNIAGRVFGFVVDAVKGAIGIVVQLGEKLLWVGGLLGGVLLGVSGLIGKQALSMGGWMQQTNIAFTTMIGNAKEAQGFLGKLRSLAMETPFTFKAAVAGARQLLAYGFEWTGIPDMLKTISDTGSAFGATEEVLQRITLALGQIKAKGFASGEEMRQFAEAGIPAWQMLASYVGKSIPEAMRLAETRAIDATTAINGLLSGMKARFGGLSSLLMNTLPGAWSNLVDVWEYSMTKLGMILAPLATRLLKSFTGAIMKFSESGVLEKIGNAVAGWFSKENIRKALVFFGNVWGIAAKAYSFIHDGWTKVVSWFSDEKNISQIAMFFANIAVWGIRAVDTIADHLKSLFPILQLLQPGGGQGNGTTAAIKKAGDFVNPGTKRARYEGDMGMIGNPFAPIGDKGKGNFDKWKLKHPGSPGSKGLPGGIPPIPSYSNPGASFTAMAAGSADPASLARIWSGVYGGIMDAYHAVKKFMTVSSGGVKTSWINDFTKSMSDVGSAVDKMMEDIDRANKATNPHNSAAFMEEIYGGGDLTREVFKRASFGGGERTRASQIPNHIEMRIPGFPYEQAIAQRAADLVLKEIHSKLGGGRSGVQPIRIGVSAT